jgi:hypothetical protein
MKVSSEEKKDPMEDLNLQGYDAISIGKIAEDLPNVCNFVRINMVS